MNSSSNNLLSLGRKRPNDYHPKATDDFIFNDSKEQAIHTNLNPLIDPLYRGNSKLGGRSRRHKRKTTRKHKRKMRSTRRRKSHSRRSKK